MVNLQSSSYVTTRHHIFINDLKCVGPILPRFPLSSHGPDRGIKCV